MCLDWIGAKTPRQVMLEVLFEASHGEVENSADIYGLRFVVEIAYRCLPMLSPRLFGLRLTFASIFFHCIPKRVAVKLFQKMKSPPFKSRMLHMIHECNALEEPSELANADLVEIFADVLTAIWVD